MMPTAPRLPGHLPSRFALPAMVVVLAAVLGPATSESAAAVARGHACCCGSTCRMGCCCDPKPAERDRPGEPSPESPFEAAALLAAETSPCIGPRPCGGDADAPPSLSSHRDRPAALTSVAPPELEEGRSPLPRSFEHLSPALPGDLPDEPPEREAAGPLR